MKTEIQSSSAVDGVNLFKHAYVQNMKSLSYYRNVKSRIQILSANAEYLAQHAELVYLCDSEYPEIVYSVLCYSQAPNKTIVYFAYTKYNFRGYGFCSKLLRHIDNGSPKYHCVPRVLTPKWERLWKQYQQLPPLYCPTSET
jgi:hypothetical protein